MSLTEIFLFRGKETAQQLRALNTLVEDLGLASVGSCMYMVQRNLHRFIHIY